MPLGHVFGIDGRWLGVDAVDHAPQRVEHVQPVGGRGPDVDEDALQIGGDHLQHGRTGFAIHLDMEIRLEHDGVAGGDLGARESGPPAFRVPHHTLYRVHGEMDAEPVAVQFHRDRVDEERHVVVDDVDDRVRSIPALGRTRGCVDAHEGRASRALHTEFPVRVRGRREVLGRSFLEVDGGNTRVVVPHEPLELVGSDGVVSRDDVAARVGNDVVEQSVVKRAIGGRLATSNVTTSFGARVGASRHDRDHTRPVGR